MSSFQYGLGTSMAENIPFIHTMALGVYESMKLSYSVEEMMPTILITVCISTILNGLAFYLVGYFRLGYILHFFPRHVILGMTFGFGIFLLLTSLQVTTGIMPDSNIFINIITMGWNNFIQFSLVCILEIFLRIVSIFEFGETAGPIIMFIIPLFFYFILWLNNISLDQAREANWLFPVAESSHGWDMWDHFSFVDVQWGIVLLQLPTILSLGAFTLLLVPIRIPTLSMITGDDVDFDSELKAQGLGNIFSGILGSVHNYLSYSNSVFYYNIGGGGKISQFVIAILTGILFLVGPQIINIVPRIIAGVIMLHLAFDLLNDSALASRRALDSLEYTSVILVGLIVTIFGFVPGIVAGGVSACVTFVVQSSKGSNVRGVFTGEVVRSNTAWTGKRRDKLEQGLARHGVYVIQLQGHIFFGNIQQVVNSIETIIQEGYKRDSPNGIAMGSGTTPNVSPKSFYSPSYRKNYLSTESDPSIPQLDIPSPPLVGGLSSIESNSPDPAPEYVVLDCSFVSGLDGNAVEGFLKLQKRLQAEDYIPNPIFLTFAGLQSSLQDMFAVHQAEFARRAINNIQSNLNDQRSSTEPTERSRLLSISSDEENGLRSYRSNEDEHSNIFHNENGVENENDIHNDNNQNQINNYNNQNYENNDNINNCNNNSNNKQQQLLLLSLQSNQINNEQYQGNQIQSQLNGNVASEIIKRKRKPPKYRRMKSEPPNTQFHSDVNTALQVVEEHIIDSIDSPRASPTMSHRLLDTSQPNSSISSDPYHRFESLDEADPYVTSIINSSIQKSVSFESNDQSNADSITSSSSLIIPPNNLNINSIINSTSSTTVAHPLVPSLNLNTRRRSRSQPYDDTSYYLGSSFIPPTSTSTNSCIIPPSMTMVSPLKDISRSKRIFSPTENFLPMTIGMSHGVSGMVTNQSKPPSGQSSPRSTLLDLAKETQRIPSESFPINPNIILNENLKIRKSSSQSNLPTLTHSLSIEIPEDPIIPLNNYNYNINSNVNENTNGNGNYNGSQSNKPDEMQRLLRRLLYELSSDLGDQDVTVLKKLADYFRRDIRTVDVGECLWCARDPAVQMGFLISGRMEAMLGNQKEKRTLQIILPGTFMGELGLLSGKIHSRTIVATQKSQVAILTKETLSHIQKEDINLLCTLQKLALRTAAIRSTQLMLFSAGSLGPK